MRQLVLEKAINETQPESHKKKLGDLCRTRWVHRQNALTLETFQKLHPSVVACMETICHKGPKVWSSCRLLARYMSMSQTLKF